MSSNSQTVHRYEVPFWRVLFVYGVVIAVVIVLTYRLVTQQVLEYSTWQRQAVENYTTEIRDPAPRGIIYDRNGYILARNIASYNVVITPAGLPDDEADIQRIYREVSTLTGVPVGGPVTEESLNSAKLVSPCVEGPSIADMVALGESLAPYTAVKISCNISEELARVIRERAVDWPGVSLEIEPIRDYPTGSLTAAVVGFLGPIPAALEGAYTDRNFVPNRDKIGYAGVETSLDDILLGTNGLRVVQRDVAGAILRNLEPPLAPVAGNNVVLTIDTRLQKAAEAVLIDEINFWNTFFGEIHISSGIVIAMNPKTGEILAMVTYPTFENNRMARFIPGYYYDQLIKDPRRPLVNNAIAARYPPGSTYKLTTATGAYNEGVVTPEQIIETPGKLELCERFRQTDPCTERNTRPFVDWIYNRRGVINEAGFGALDFLHCIAYSSNVCFYKLGGGFPGEIEDGGLGILRLGEYAKALGYGARSGIQLPGENEGLVPTPQWKRINTGESWSTGDTYIASVGQGYVLGTPLQVLMSGATIANRGKLMQPTIVREIQDNEGRVIPVWFDPVDFAIYEMREIEQNGRTRTVYVDPSRPDELLPAPPDGSYQISPFTPNLKWDITERPMIQIFNCDVGYCDPTGEFKIVRPEAVEAVRIGTRLAVSENPLGTLNEVFTELVPLPIAVAGKTGTAEYCDDVARELRQCQFGSWPTHAWTLAYAPYDDPEIAILAFAYHGEEGGSVAAPIVARVMQAYFELKSIDLAQQSPGN